jgi:Predicted hydrolases or acyltransferases (alpha/beta hydrolase superfamily)
MTLQPSGTLAIGDAQIEYRMIGPMPDAAPTLVLLHEGLGCAALWGDFPQRLADVSGCGVFVYSRAGYGASSPAAMPRGPDYMHVEALDVLPRVLDAIGFKRGFLVGHSDGASIAAIYAGGIQDHRVRGVALLAPHFVMEEMNLKAIAKTRDDYRNTELRAKLARWHQHVDNAFTAGTTPGSIRNSAIGISRNISLISACRSRSFRARTISMAPTCRSRSRKRNAIARWM